MSLPPKPPQIGASILTADLLRLGQQIDEATAAGIDFIHLDVMDGHFVPNITFGPLLVETVRRATSLPLDVHLMIEDPARYVDAFVDAGADTLTIHAEADTHLNRTLSHIKQRGVRAGVTMNPATPLVMIEEVLPICDQVLVMSVDPGFGGQSFIPRSIDKIRRAADMIERRQPGCNLEVDGGLKATNIAKVRAAGADMFVVGSGVFNDRESVSSSIASLRAAVGGVDRSTGDK